MAPVPGGLSGFPEASPGCLLCLYLCLYRLERFDIDKLAKLPVRLGFVLGRLEYHSRGCALTWRGVESGLIVAARRAIHKRQGLNLALQSFQYRASDGADRSKPSCPRTS